MRLVTNNTTALTVHKAGVTQKTRSDGLVPPTQRTLLQHIAQMCEISFLHGVRKKAFPQSMTNVCKLCKLQRCAKGKKLVQGLGDGFVDFYRRQLFYWTALWRLLSCFICWGLGQTTRLNGQLQHVIKGSMMLMPSVATRVRSIARAVLSDTYLQQRRAPGH